MSTEVQKRGMLTQRIKRKSVELLGYEINTTELRLMAYIQYVIVNEQRIDPRKINQEERAILSLWRKMEHIEGGASGLRISEEFWNIICEIIKLGYVDIDVECDKDDYDKERTMHFLGRQE
jgi:hypothetical protein